MNITAIIALFRWEKEPACEPNCGNKERQAVEQYTREPQCPLSVWKPPAPRVQDDLTAKVVLSGLAVEIASIYRVRQWLVNRYQHEESSRVDPQYSAGLTMGLSGKSASWLHVLGYWGVARSLATAWPRHAGMTCWETIDSSWLAHKACGLIIQ